MLLFAARLIALGGCAFAVWALLTVNPVQLAWALVAIAAGCYGAHLETTR